MPARAAPAADSYRPSANTQVIRADLRNGGSVRGSTKVHGEQSSTSSNTPLLSAYRTRTVSAEEPGSPAARCCADVVAAGGRRPTQSRPLRRRRRRRGRRSVRRRGRSERPTPRARPSRSKELSRGAPRAPGGASAPQAPATRDGVQNEFLVQRLLPSRSSPRPRPRPSRSRPLRGSSSRSRWSSPGSWAA